MTSLEGRARDPGWYVEDLVSTLTVGPGGARLHERWSVVAELPLEELLLELNLDGAAPPGATVVDAPGAEVVPDPLPAGGSGRPVVGVRLPRPLGPWETHTFGLLLTRPGPPDGALPRRHVVVPGGPVLRLEVRVRFDVPDPPRAVTLLDGGETGGCVPLDPTGGVACAFPDLRPGLPYGVTW
jgi:hypothetical protein